MKIQKWDEINGTGSSEERMEAFLTSENDTYAILQLSYDQPEVTAYERFESLNGLARQGRNSILITRRTSGGTAFRSVTS